MDSSSLQSHEFQQFINQEKQKAAVSQMIGKLTSACWDKCITGTKFSSTESKCLAHCAQRYLDSSLVVMKRLHQL